MQFRYQDFIKLFEISGNPLTWTDGLSVKPEGVFRVLPPVDVLITADERAVLSEHPTGRYDEPVLAFPCSFPELEKFVADEGLAGNADAIVMAEIVMEWHESLKSDRPERWPWGDHTTKGLEDLAAAGETFWRRYDPRDPSTAETNERVSAWLQNERQVTRNRADFIASLLRDDDLPSGPRRKT